MRSAPAVAFDYRPSRRALALFHGFAVAACAAPWFSALPVAVQMTVSCSAAVIAIVESKAFRKPEFRRVAHTASGWRLVDEAGTEHAVDLVSHRRAAGCLALLFRDNARRRFPVVLTCDNIDSDTRRALIVLLARADLS